MTYQKGFLDVKSLTWETFVVGTTDSGVGVGSWGLVIKRHEVKKGWEVGGPSTEVGKSRGVLSRPR